MKCAPIVAGLVAIAAPAQAATWRWRAPPECSESALRTSLAIRLDGTVDALPLDVDVTITASGGGFTATLVVGGAVEDTRTLTSASCGELTDAIAIVVARLASVVERPRVAAVAPPPTGLVEIGPFVAHAIERPRNTWNAGARASAVVGAGAVPALGVAADLGLWVCWRSVSLELAASRWKSNTATVADGTMAGVDVGLESLAIRAGWRPADRPIRSWLVGELGSIGGTGSGITDVRRGSARWSAVGGGGAYAWPVADHVVLVAGGELEFLIDRVTFAFSGGSAIYETPPIAVRASLGVEVGWR